MLSWYDNHDGQYLYELLKGLSSSELRNFYLC